MNQFCAVDLEMNNNHPLAVAMVKGYLDGSNLVITDSATFAFSQKGHKINHYVRNHVVTEPELWSGKDTCKDAVLKLIEISKDCDTIFSWGKESHLLAKLFVCGKMDKDVRCKHILRKLVDSQKMFEDPKNLKDMYNGLASRPLMSGWHHPLRDASATLEIALLHGMK